MPDFVPVEQDAQFVPIEDAAKFVPVEETAQFVPVASNDNGSSIGDLIANSSTINVPIATAIDAYKNVTEKSQPSSIFDLSSAGSDILKTGKGLLEAASLPFTPVQGALYDTLGKLMAHLPGMNEQKAREAIDMALLAAAPEKGKTFFKPSDLPPTAPEAAASATPDFTVTPEGVASPAPGAAPTETATPKIDLPPEKVKEVSDLMDDGMERGPNALITSKPLEELRQAADAPATETKTPEMTTVQVYSEGSAKPPTSEIPTETIVKEPFSRDVNNAVLDLLNAGKVRLAPDVKVSDQVRDLLQTNIIDPDTFNGILEKHGVSPVKFLEEVTQGDVGKAMRESATQSARTLQQLSELRKAEMRIRALSGEKSEEVSNFLKDQDNSIGNGMASLMQRANNIWRSLLVSQLATAARNATTQAARAGIDVLQRGIEQGLRTVFVNPLRRVTGKEPLTDPIDTFGTVMTMLGPKRAAAITDAVTSVSPKVRESLFSRYMSDVSRATGGKGVLGKVEGAADWLNTFNRAQEFFFRRAFFAESLGRRLKAKGQSIDEIVKNNAVGSIPKEDIEGAVSDALEKTWARPLPNTDSAFSYIAKGLSKIPFSPVPFVRFMVDAMRFQYDFSPLGAVRLLRPKELAALASGEPKQMAIASKALAGSVMLYGAYNLRNSQYAGAKWYEVNLPGGRKMDIRPYAPFSSYVFVADLIKRLQDGTLLGMDAKDIAQGIIGTNFRAGAGLYLVDQLIDDLAGVDSVDKIGKIVKTYAGNVLAGFVTPFQMLKDAVGQFDPSERIVRDTKQNPLLGPSMNRIPYADQNLPPAESPTHSGGYTREAPLLRQLTGITIADKSSPAEDEMARLGIKRSEIMPTSGDPVYDTEMAKHMSKIIEQGSAKKGIPPLNDVVNSQKYQAIQSNKIKAVIMTEAMSAIRQQAAEEVKQEDKLTALRKRYNSLSQRKRAVIQEMLQQRGRTLNLQPQVSP